MVITIHGTNDAPVAVADGYDTIEGGVLSVAAANGLLANDTDVDAAEWLRRRLSALP